MHHLLNRRTALLFGAASSVCLTSPALAQDPASAAQYIREKSAAWTNAYVTGNTEVMEAILAPDFVSTNPKGQRSGKAATIEAAKRAPSDLLSAAVGNIEVRVLGNLAIAFGSDSLVLRDEKKTQIATAWTDTWYFDSGQWLVLASHESVVKLAAPQ